LKQRLKEKEELAIKNRELALQKMVNKLAKHDDHAKLVLERKKQMQNSNDDLAWDHDDSMVYRTASGRSNATDATASDEQDAEPKKVHIERDAFRMGYTN
jgi:hypothetical protein